ncbi:MAG: hypothetical protein ACRC9R_11755, partial [Enterovibrio sp.]
ALQPGQAQAAPTADNIQIIDYIMTRHGLLYRNSLASILHPWNARLGLLWNAQSPAAASSALEGQRLLVSELMRQLSFNLQSANLSGVTPHEQATVRVLLETFNSNNDYSTRIRILLVVAYYMRSELYYRVTGDLCRLLNINPRTAAGWTNSFEQTLIHLTQVAPRTSPLPAAIAWLSQLPLIADQHTIEVIPPPTQGGRRALPAPAHAAATATATRGTQAAQATPQQARPRQAVPTPEQLLLLNLPAAQGAAPVPRPPAQHVRQHYHPYPQPRPQRAADPRQRPQPPMQVQPQQQVPAPTLRFPPQYQLPTPMLVFPPQPAPAHLPPQPATRLRFAQQPPQQQQQLDEQQQLQEQQRQQQQARQTSVIVYAPQAPPKDERKE